MSDLFGNHIVGFPTRRLIYQYVLYVSAHWLAVEGIQKTTSGQGILALHMSRLVGKPTMWFPNRSDTNRPVQAQKRARSLKFRIKVEEELYYPSSENKGADQLRGHRKADLRLCFRLCRLLVFP